MNVEEKTLENGVELELIKERQKKKWYTAWSNHKKKTLIALTSLEDGHVFPQSKNEKQLTGWHMTVRFIPKIQAKKNSRESTFAKDFVLKHP